MLKYQINTNVFSGSTGATINIPIGLTSYPTDNSDLIKTNFVDKEVAKAINPPVDNERIRLTPLYSAETTQALIDFVNYNLIFTATTGNLSTFAEITTTTPFNNDDLKFRRNNLKNTFLRLLFYDSDIPTNQQLISTLEIFVNIPDTISSLGYINTQLIIQPVQFQLSNPITNPKGFAEGFYLYHYKDDVDLIPALPKALYMRAEFNNAKDGKTTKLITKQGPISIGELTPYIHTRYLLTRTLDGYYYMIDDEYSSGASQGDPDNVSYSIGTTNTVTVKLFELNVS